jgi:methyl-accepting chemotaxis protein
MQRVMLSVAVPAGLLVVLSVGIGIGTVSMERQLSAYFAQEDALASEAGEMLAQGLQMGQALRNIVLDPANKRAYENLDSAAKAYEDAAQGASAAAKPEQQLKLKAMAVLRARLADVQKQVKDLAQQDAAAAAQMLNKQETPAWRELRAELVELKKVSTASKESAAAEAAAAMDKARLIVILLAVISVAASIFSIVQLRRCITRELGGDPAAAREVLERVASGDLLVEVPVPPGDTHSMMAALQRTRDALRALVSDVNAAAQSIALASSEIAVGNQDLSNRTES